MLGRKLENQSKQRNARLSVGETASLRSVFFEVANCEVAFGILDGAIRGAHPCRAIVESQAVESTMFQLPEP